VTIGTAANILVVVDVTDLDVLSWAKTGFKGSGQFTLKTFSSLIPRMGSGFGYVDDLVPHSQHTVRRLDQEGTTAKVVSSWRDAFPVSFR